MRAVTVELNGATRGALQHGQDLHVVDTSDAVTALLVDARPTGQVLRFSEATLAPVVPRPAKFICVGRNYAEHAKELARDLPDHPTLFARFATSLIGARDDIHCPRVSDQLDWEGELAVVIGRPVTCIDEAAARAAILGYTIFNDVSVRDWQWRTTQWLQGKTFDRTGPLGPSIVTEDELHNADDLEISVEVDGVTMQRARTKDMIFSPAQVVSYISQFCTLEPGDVIATGTPSGVGAARDPKVYLRPGQVVRTAIEGIGACVNQVRSSR